LTVVKALEALSFKLELLLGGRPAEFGAAGAIAS